MKRNLATSLLAWSLPLAANATDKPNIIIFLVDDMGVMDTSVEFLTNSNGEVEHHPLNDWYRTPSMERLAQQGVRFSNFYAQNVSTPSRISIMTGQNAVYHHTTNWIDAQQNNPTQFGPRNWNWEGLTTADPTIARLVRSQGYRTIHVGKAHFGAHGYQGEDPRNIGFDVNIGGSGIGHPGSYYGEDGYGAIKGAKSHAVPNLEKYHGTDTFLTEALTLEAKRAIGEAVEAGQPFFLNMAHYAVHSPFQPDPRFVDNYPQSEGKSERASAFASLIEGMDKSLGDLLDYLEEIGEAENTFIIFLGDNGSDAPLGGIEAHSASAPLRGIKGSVYEGGVRVPFIASWAKVSDKSENQQRFAIESGAITTTRGTVMDIYPTILELTQTKDTEGHKCDGQTLWKIFGGKNDPRHTTDILLNFPHEHRGSYFSTYIEGDWKVIYRFNPTNPTEPIYELYNLSDDPYENQNLAVENKSKLTKMMRTMVTKLDREGAQYPIDSTGSSLYPIIP